MRPVKQRQFHVFERGSAGEEIKALKNETEFAVAHVGELIAIQSGNIRTVEQIAALGWAIEATEKIHEGRFAGATRTHEGDKLTRLNLQRDAADGVHINLPGVIGLVHILQPNDRVFHCVSRWLRTAVARRQRIVGGLRSALCRPSR